MKTIKVSCCKECHFSEFPAKAEMCFHDDIKIEDCDITDPEKILDNCPLKNNPVTIYYLPHSIDPVQENT